MDELLNNHNVQNNITPAIFENSQAENESEWSFNKLWMIRVTGGISGTSHVLPILR